jgi:biofilm PGA synthesis protein PgaD
MTPALKTIDKPERQHPIHRTLWGTVTAAFWLFYLYLLLPLATLLLWLLGVRNAYTELYLREAGIDAFLLGTLPVLALLCAAVVIVWAEYNRNRFQGQDRRQPQADATREDIAASLGASDTLAAELLTARRTLIQMDAQARPVDLLDGPVGPAAIS